MFNNFKSAEHTVKNFNTIFINSSDCAADKEKDILSSATSDSSIAVISKTLNGIITNWNSGAEKMFGYSTQEAVGGHIGIIFPVEKLHEEFMIIEKIMKGIIIMNFETIRIRKDGTSFPASVTAISIKNDDGKIIGVTKIISRIAKAS